MHHSRLSVLLLGRIITLILYQFVQPKLKMVGRSGEIWGNLIANEDANILQSCSKCQGRLLVLVLNTLNPANSPGSPVGKMLLLWMIVLQCGGGAWEKFLKTRFNFDERKRRRERGRDRYGEKFLILSYQLSFFLPYFLFVCFGKRTYREGQREGICS